MFAKVNSVFFTYFFLGFLLVLTNTYAQSNYEIQVYGSEQVAKDTTMFELHSNFTSQGSILPVDGVLPTNHSLHETIEITRGITNWFEVGFYIFTNQTPHKGYQWVGDHIRPRIRIPEEWHWPVGISLSNEIGYQRSIYSTDTYTWEIRPIIDKKYRKFYIAFNPVIDKSFKGQTSGQGYSFAPALKLNYRLTKKLLPGIEYYAANGPFKEFLPYSQQQQQIFPTLDIDLDPRWELNCGVGFALNKATDNLIFKVIVGRSF